jgi:hypothetical protein
MTIKTARRAKRGTYRRMCRFREGACRDGNASIVYIYALSFVFSMNGVAE